MLDIDDFKRVNDVYGHGAGDEILRGLAETLKDTVRNTDVVYRLGGEEFAIVIASRSPESAERLAHRLVERVEATEFDPAGRITISVGLARGPEHAMNPRELIACAEAAMMTAKARGKNQIVLYDESSLERPEGLAVPSARDVRSVAHLKMLQTLGGKLNRLNDVREIGNVIATELRSLIDYHNCRVSIVDGEDVLPIAFVGMFTSETQEPLEILACKVGQGITGRVAQTGESLLIADAANCEFSRILPGTAAVDESQVVVPLTYGTRVVGVIVISKLGLNQFDEDDVRLMEVLAGHAAVALENASLYEAARREAERATALLEFSRQLASADGMEEVVDRIVELSARTLDSPRTSVWLQERAARRHHDAREPRLSRARPRPAGSDALRPRRGRRLPCRRRAVRHDGERDRGRRRELAIAPLSLEGGRLGFIAVAAPDDGAHRAHAPPACRHRPPGEAGARQRLQLPQSRADVPRDRRGARERARGKRRVHLLACALDHGPLAEGRRGPRPRRPLAQAARARRALPRHREDRNPGGDPLQARPADPEERKLVETHPELGERIIAPIDRLEDVRPIVRHCHERYDGEGYPDQRKGEEIPIESRIIFVCDAYHAMTTDRPYRKRLPREEALRRLKEAAGTQFDPRVVDVCVDVLAELGA